MSFIPVRSPLSSRDCIQKPDCVWKLCSCSPTPHMFLTVKAKGFSNLGNLTWVGFSTYKDVPTAFAQPWPAAPCWHVVSTHACQASLPGFSSALGYTGVWQHTQSCQWHCAGQASARDGVAKAGLVGTVVFRRLSTGMCAPGWALTQCFGDTPAGSPHRAVPGCASSVLSIVTGPGLVFTQMIWKVQCCWV